MRQSRPLRVGKIIPGTFAFVIRQFLKWMDTQNYAVATRKKWEHELRLAEKEDGLGGCSVQVIRPAVIQAFLDSLAHYPGKQAVSYTALKQLEKFAVVRELIPIPFMTGTSIVGSDGGHEPWPDLCVKLAEDHAATPLSRAVTLAINTGQRGSDVVRMRPNDIEERLDPTTGIYRRGINVAQQKTGKKLWVPFIDQAFEQTLRTWEKRPGPFIVTQSGTAYSRSFLSKSWTIERDTNTALQPLKDAGLVLHGLRATAVVRARKRGLSDLQIANIYGMSPPMVGRYSRLADQGQMAMAAIHFLDRTGGEQVTSNSSNITNLKR